MSRHSDLTAALFETYKDVTGLELAAIFNQNSQAGGAAIKKLLKVYPQERDDEIVESWRRFLVQTEDLFDMQNQTVHYWANKKVNQYWPTKKDVNGFEGTSEYRNGYSESDERCPDCRGTGWTTKSHVLHLGHTAKQYGPCACRNGQFKGVRK